MAVRGQLKKSGGLTPAFFSGLPKANQKRKRRADFIGKNILFFLQKTLAFFCKGVWSVSQHFFKGVFYALLLDCAAFAGGSVYFADAFGLAAFGGFVMFTTVMVCRLAAGGSVALLDAALRKVARACKSRRAWLRLRDMAAAACDIAWHKKAMAAYVAANAWRCQADNALAQFTLCGRALIQVRKAGKTHLRAGGRYVLRRYGRAGLAASGQRLLSGIN